MIRKNIKSQRKIARSIGISQSCLSRILRGLVAPKPETARRIGNYLGVTPGAIIDMPAGHLADLIHAQAIKEVKPDAT